MSAESSSVPKVTVVRDIQGRQMAYVDMSIGYAAAAENIGPSYQRIVLGGGEVTVFADYSLNRLIFAPQFMRTVLQGTHRQHLFDLPSKSSAQCRSTRADCQSTGKTYDTDSEGFTVPGEPIDIRNVPDAQKDSGTTIDSLNLSETAVDLHRPSAAMETDISSHTPANSQNSTVKLRIKRPRNSWVIYRSEKSKFLHQTSPGMSAGAISTEVARLWKNEPKEIKKFYQSLADIEAQEHKQRYPHYRYAPGRGGFSKE